MPTETKAVQYLVNDGGTTHLPYTDASGKPDHRLMGAAWAALHEGYRGNKYDGPSKGTALSKLIAVYKREGMDTPGSAKSSGLLEFKSVRFEVKELSENGSFTGVASVYGNKDLGNDVMEKGAFTKTLAERGGKVRLMDSHKVRIGIAEVKDTSYGLETKGVINLEKQSGQDVYSDLKFYQQHGLPMGLSIGYQTVKADAPAQTSDGARHLKEVCLWEVTVTEFPMNTEAQVTAVKSSFRDILGSARAIEGKDDFAGELRSIQLYAAGYMMMQALSSALCDIRCDDDLMPDDKATASGDSIDQFKAVYLEFLPEYLAMMSGDSDAFEQMSLRVRELKAGRRNSAADAAEIKKAIDILQALIDDGAGDATPADDAAAKSVTEPGDHSGAVSLVEQMRKLIPA